MGSPFDVVAIVPRQICENKMHVAFDAVSFMQILQIHSSSAYHVSFSFDSICR